MPDIALKRVYERPSPQDGLRVLVDRLWPRGISKQRAQLDLWDKDVAPSVELRTSWHRGDVSFEDFSAAYRAELAASGAARRLLGWAASAPRMSLIFAARDERMNHVVVLADVLRTLSS
ncbi:DUF488 domain-containing protein [Olsenella sp. HMSC062G07]|uniref:DUF488 domain-containing protein n=1 Tax=Olsenella sp. HMSC062G07 TaxID=1739330 RepID=UPI0008A10D87|nr:DUF488 family protein [Olsenella sp. HMSC062G07]OFK24340.1 MarR family transcriptional regulator [Olsenella sp. HMSC062G07]